MDNKKSKSGLVFLVGIILQIIIFIFLGILEESPVILEVIFLLLIPTNIVLFIIYLVKKTTSKKKETPNITAAPAEDAEMIEYIASKNISDYHKSKYGNEGKIYFTLFDKQIDVLVDFDVDIDYAEKCVDHLNHLNNQVISDLCNGSIAYCEDYRDTFEECEISIPVNLSEKQILQYIYPRVLIIDKPTEDKIGYHIECDCAWEEEHGLEWTIKEDKVLYVGQYHDETAWKDEGYYQNASWNYINKL